jgi:hypothetical protein
MTAAMIASFNRMEDPSLKYPYLLATPGYTDDP